MSIKRFVAPNGREALAQVRRELGEDALVLSTRKLTGGRVEILAVGADDMQSLIEESPGRSRTARAGMPPMAAATEITDADDRKQAPAVAPQPETFEAFLRRQAQRQAAAAPGAASHAAPMEAPASSVRRRDDPPATPAQVPLNSAAPAPQAEASVFRRRVDERSAPVEQAEAMPVNEPVAQRHTAPAAALLGPTADARLLAELQSMRALLLEQMATMSTANTAAELHRRNPMQVRAMTRLMVAGFSPDVARHIAERAPAAATPADSDRWLTDVLALNVRCADAADDWLGSGGVFALVGPTGVGKTTTVAKLAARFAMRHGAQALGLITLDAFRVGAHEQLRAYGRILGTPVHLAQDAATLRDLLTSMAGKRLVLIDTCGVSQRDERLTEMLAMLEQASAGQRPIERLLLLNAASHAETLDDVARAWQARQCAGALLTKLDEAVRIGGALDCALRHKLTVLGATNGQRVPEDWVVAESRELAAAALKPGHSAFTIAEAEGAVLAAHAQRAGMASVL